SRLRYDGRVVTIRRDVLDLHLMLTNSVLVQLFDSKRYHPDHFDDLGPLSREIITSHEKQLFYHVGMQPDSVNFRRGFQILTTQQSRKILLRRLINGNDEEKQYA